MSTCCESDSCNTAPRKAVCPVNGKSYPRVSRKTLLHHLKKPWQVNVTEQDWYFCDSPDCDVVYFNVNAQTFLRQDLRTDPGQKSTAAERTLCYCFDVTAADYQSQPDETKTFVIDQTRSSTCDCEIRNPAGRCCLKDFPKQ